MKESFNKAWREAQAHADAVLSILDGESGVAKCDRCGKYTSFDQLDVHDNDEIICMQCTS